MPKKVKPKEKMNQKKIRIPRDGNTHKRIAKTKHTMKKIIITTMTKREKNNCQEK